MRESVRIALDDLLMRLVSLSKSSMRLLGVALLKRLEAHLEAHTFEVDTRRPTEDGSTDEDAVLLEFDKVLDRLFPGGVMGADLEGDETDGRDGSGGRVLDDDVTGGTVELGGEG